MFEMEVLFLFIVVGGLIVGFGIWMGLGCISGYGVCGILWFLFRLISVIFIFMLIGMVIVFFFCFFIIG